MNRLRFAVLALCSTHLSCNLACNRINFASRNIDDLKDGLCVYNIATKRRECVGLAYLCGVNSNQGVAGAIQFKVLNRGNSIRILRTSYEPLVVESGEAVEFEVAPQNWGFSVCSNSDGKPAMKLQVMVKGVNAPCGQAPCGQLLEQYSK